MMTVRLILRSFQQPNGCKKFRHLTFSTSTQSFVETSKTAENTEFDVVIVGGGMVGAAVGCGLASNKLTSSLRVAIVDGKSTNTVAPLSPIPDARVSAITPATVSFLKEVGAWKHIENSRHAPFRSMQVWDYTGLGYTRYSAADVGKPVLGYVVENNVILSALYSSLQEMEFANIICPATVKSVNLQPGSANEHQELDGNTDLAKVELDDGRCLYTRLVVGADGAKSKVRTLAGLDTYRQEYKQNAVVATLEMDRTNSTAWQRFLPTGPLAILPMGGALSNIVWTSTPEKARDLTSISDENFVEKVNSALFNEYAAFPSSNASSFFGRQIGSFLGDVPSCSELFEPPPRVTRCLSKRAAFPLSLGHAYKYILPRLALVGDAAHTVHPLAGQGVNLGFGDAAALVNVLSSCIEEGADIGEASRLETYERMQLLSNVPMMAILHGFQRMYSVDFGPLNAARAAAFQAVQLLSPLKRKVISYAMGESKLLNLPIFQ